MLQELVNIQNMSALVEPKAHRQASSTPHQSSSSPSHQPKTPESAYSPSEKSSTQSWSEDSAKPSGRNMHSARDQNRAEISLPAAENAVLLEALYKRRRRSDHNYDEDDNASPVKQMKMSPPAAVSTRSSTLLQSSMPVPFYGYNQQQYLPNNNFGYPFEIPPQPYNHLWNAPPNPLLYESSCLFQTTVTTSYPNPNFPPLNNLVMGNHGGPHMPPHFQQYANSTPYYNGGYPYSEYGINLAAPMRSSTSEDKRTYQELKPSIRLIGESMAADARHCASAPPGAPRNVPKAPPTKTNPTKMFEDAPCLSPVIDDSDTFLYPDPDSESNEEPPVLLPEVGPTEKLQVKSELQNCLDELEDFFTPMNKPYRTQ